MSSHSANPTRLEPRSGLISLIEMAPRGDLTSTAYALANPGQEYLVLEPGGTGAFTVELVPGTYRSEWYRVNGRETLDAGEVTVERAGTARFTPPFQDPGPSVLYLKRVPG